jgi:uncharacterized protein
VIGLLDVNVLVALFDDLHVHHEAAHGWFADHVESGWASCPLTENGMLRILSAPGRAEPYVPLPELVGLLQRFRENTKHQFWPDDVSLRDTDRFDVERIRGRRHLTDVYLLGLAVRNGGAFVTFDTGVPLAAVKGARQEHIVVLAGAE